MIQIVYLSLSALGNDNESHANNNISTHGATAEPNANTGQPTDLPTHTTPTDDQNGARTHPLSEQDNADGYPTEYPGEPTSNPPYDYDYNGYDDDWYDYGYYDYDYDYYFGGLEEETKEQQYEIEEAIRAVVALQNDSAIVDMGHQFEDLVFECSFRGYDCRCLLLS